MKLINILPLVVLSTAYVLPDQVLIEQIAAQPIETPKSFDKIPSKGDIFSHVEEAYHKSIVYGKNALDKALSAAENLFKSETFSSSSLEAFDTQGWLDSVHNFPEQIDEFAVGDHPHHPPHCPGHPHHGEPNQTVYELIAGSKYTTKLAELINDYDDLVQLLNGTTANFTVFAPIDEAFEKIPPHHEKPSKEIIKKILTYHVSPDFYPAKRVLFSHTIPTAWKEERLGGEPQRLRVGLGLKGLNINFYSHIRAFNIFGTNGVIHGIDSILLPPPPAHAIIALLPGDFSTFQLALTKTGLGHAIAASNQTGGTIFAPSNSAFKKLGPKVNAFLFSSYGEKYLRALLKYHIVANQTLYSDAFYPEKDGSDDGAEHRPFHIDLPTLLADKSLAVDIVRYGGFINIRVNAYTDVAVQDGVAKDGVIQVPRNVLIPPKTRGGEAYRGEELGVEDFKSRFEGLVEEEEEEEEEKAWWEL